MLINSENTEITEMTEDLKRSSNENFLTTSQAAKILSVSPDTVLKWVKAGKIKSSRTLGGHFRIPLSALDLISPRQPKTTNGIGGIEQPLSYQYCWEYLAGGSDIKSECRDFITFRSRARRCYKLKDLPGGLGCLNLLCDTNCTECDYYDLVSGQDINILIVSENNNIIKDADKIDNFGNYRIKFSNNEYQAAVLIQSFCPGLAGRRNRRNDKYIALLSQPQDVC